MKLFALVATCAALLRAQAPPPPAYSSLPDDTVIATADAKPITAGEIRAWLKSGNPQMMALFSKNPDQFLGTFAQMRYLIAEAEKGHLLEQSPWKEQVEELRNRVEVNAEINRVRETYNVPEKAINEYYAENKDKYAQAWIKVIVLGFCPDAPKPNGTSVEAMKKAAEAAVAHANCSSKRSEEEAHSEATAIVGRIRGGEDFLTYVKKYSEDDDSKSMDGDFGLVTAESPFKPEIKKAVFALKDGEISDPIRSGASFYIIKIKERTIQPLSNVMESVISDLKQKHFTEWMQDLNKQFKPEIKHPEFFEAPGTAPKPGTQK